jgi:hypothetical protein
MLQNLHYDVMQHFQNFLSMDLFWFKRILVDSKAKSKELQVWKGCMQFVWYTEEKHKGNAKFKNLYVGHLVLLG